MKIARVAVLVVALGAGLAAWTMARNIDSTEAAPVVQQTFETEQVLVAARDIQPGVMISSADLTWQTWPRDAVNAVFLRRSRTPDAITEMTGAVARGAFFSGEPIRDSKLVRAGRGGYLSAVLPSGMRAVATRTSPQTGAGGFILPNDRVDVILTRREASAGNAAESYSSERVLENVRVLAIDQTVEEQNGKMVVVGNVATLELKPEHTEILALAEQLGEISLALRSIMDGGGAEGSDPIAASSLGGRRAGSVSVVKFGVPSRVNAN